MTVILLSLVHDVSTSLIGVEASTDSGTLDLNDYKFKSEMNADTWVAGVQEVLDRKWGATALERRMAKMALKEGLPATWSQEYYFLKTAREIRLTVKDKLQ